YGAGRSGALPRRALAKAIMDDNLETSTSPEAGTVEAGVSPANVHRAADTAATTATAPSLALNEVQGLPGEELEVLARDLHLHLHPAHSRHQHVLEVIRAGLSGGAGITAERFVAQVRDSVVILRSQCRRRRQPHDSRDRVD